MLLQSLLSQEESITAWDMVSAGFTALADYDMEKPTGKQVRTYLYEILIHMTRLDVKVNDFLSLSRAVKSPDKIFILSPSLFLLLSYPIVIDCSPVLPFCDIVFEVCFG